MVAQESKLTSSSYLTIDENKTFYEEGFAKLRSEPLEESSGKLLMDLFDARAEKVLIPFTRNWIKKFPNHEVAPKLTGKWLMHFGTNDAMYLAVSYMKTYPDLDALKPIVRAAAKLGGKGKTLLEAIEKRMERDLNSHIWGGLQTLGHHHEKIDALILRWLKCNLSNQEIVGDLSSAVLFTDSLLVLEEALRWTELNQDKPNKRYIWMVLTHLIVGKSAAHDNISPRVIDFARTWLKKNSGNEFCGTIHRDVILRTHSPEDIENAKQWYMNNLESRSAVNALSGILKVAYQMGVSADSQIVECAKKEISSQSEIRPSGIVFALLQSCPDRQSIEISKTALRNEYNPSLHSLLLSVAPDDDLLSSANERLASSSEPAPDLIAAMLKCRPGNVAAMNAARRWLKKYPDDERAGEIKSLL